MQKKKVGTQLAVTSGKSTKVKEQAKVSHTKDKAETLSHGNKTNRHRGKGAHTLKHRRRGDNRTQVQHRRGTQVIAQEDRK